MVTAFGSQRLYQDAREGGYQDVGPPPDANQYELDIPGLDKNEDIVADDDEYDDVPLPPTLDKLLNGFDTAPIEDPWLEEKPAAEPAPPPKKLNRRERRRQKRASGKKSVGATSNTREIVAISAELAGIVALSAGFWQIAPWCGLICLGLCLILVGVAISRESGDA